ncbi:glycosyltransferase family 2 protein [Benzoatithermus flavus]|uniref:Glycosyltransferase family A protein n=1 Tax=Benzoatithermus flavus TaxID=3108223 RepID=A0ABU8XKX7_9PROT
MPSPIQVSVIVPTRNQLGRLAETLAGIVAQQVRFEAIVVDRGSTDGTWAWLGEMARTRPWLRPVRRDGASLPEACNRALREARAPLVAFLDPEDAAWRPGKLKTQRAAHAADPDLVLSFTDQALVDTRGDEHGGWLERHPFLACRIEGGRGVRRLDAGAVAALLAEDAIGISTVMARREALLRAGGFDPALGGASAWDLWLKLARQGALACTTQRLVERMPHARTLVSPHAMAEIIRRHGAAIGGGHAFALRAAYGRLALLEAAAARAAGRPGTAFLARLRALRLTLSLGSPAPPPTSAPASSGSGRASVWRDVAPGPL